MEKNQKKVQIIPLGGLGEIGKNMTVFRYGDDIILIDAGLMFPEDDMLGIDLVIPDITYLLDNKDKVKAIFLTHGHEDHIGALPYVLKNLDVPVYGTALTLGILQGRLRENNVSDDNLITIKPGDRIKAGDFTLEFIRVNHSIPDAISIVIKTPIGTIIHTGDFKFDQTPVDGQVTQFNKFAEYGDAGVLALLADSTNAERPGFTQSEKMVGQTFDDEFRYLTSLSDAAKKFVVDRGYDPMYGARPLKRYLQKNVETLAAKLILAGDIGSGDVILIDEMNEKLVARVK